MEAIVRQLTPQLFWDVDPDTIDPEKNIQWLLERVLQRGTWEDWLLISRFYGKQTIREMTPRLRVDAKSAHFLQLHGQI